MLLPQIHLSLPLPLSLSLALSLSLYLWLSTLSLSLCQNGVSEREGRVKALQDFQKGRIMRDIHGAII
jgi:hypothetical protein